MKDVATALASGETVSHAYLGVSLEDGDDAPQVTAVSDGSPAASAGLRVGDEIVEIDGDPVGSGDDLRAELEEREPGTKVTVTVDRGEERVEVEVTLGTRPS